MALVAEKNAETLEQVGEWEEDEPTQVTQLLAELKATREETRESLIRAGVCARHLRRRLRRSGSQQTLQAAADERPSDDVR